MIEQPHRPKVVIPLAGPVYRVGGDVVTFKATAADTNGIYSLFEVRSDPGSSTLPHRQRYDDEAFWILEGSYTFLLGGRDILLGAGSYVYVPRGTLHAYTCGGVPARMLILHTPGSIHERFFAEIGQPVDSQDAQPVQGTPPELDRLIAVSYKYGIEIVPPQSEPTRGGTT